MVIKFKKPGEIERLQELFLQKEYLDNLEFDFVDEKVIKTALEKVKKEINKYLKELK